MNKFKDFVTNKLSKLKEIEHIKLIAFIIIIAITLIFVSTYQKNTRNNNSSIYDGVSIDNIDKIHTANEIKLIRILQNIEGVGKVEVMIKTTGDGSDAVFGGSKTEKIEGVVVVAEGVRDIYVRLKVLDAVRTALNIDNDIIKIFIMK